MTLDESQIDERLRLLAATLRTARFARGLRLVDVASLTGLSEVHLYRLEQGERAPSLRALLVLAEALGLEPAELLAQDDNRDARAVPHTGRAIWTGTEKTGSGVMIKGGVQVRYDLAYRTNPVDTGDDESSTGTPEQLLGMAFAGCFSMALAADIDNAGFQPQRIETFAQVRTQSGAGGVMIDAIELLCEAAVPDIADTQFQTMAEQTKRSCLLARATAAVPVQLNARLVAVGG